MSPLLVARSKSYPTCDEEETMSLTFPLLVLRSYWPLIEHGSVR